MVRKAIESDVSEIISMIRELAIFELAPDEVENSEEQLRLDLFDEKCCSAFVAVSEEQIVGFALYYFSYSTWKGKCVYLEDLYVKPSFRGFGFGSQLFDAVVAVAKSEKVRRMDWQVLEWNKDAINFYKNKSATLDPEWINGRLFF